MSGHTTKAPPGRVRTGNIDLPLVSCLLPPRPSHLRCRSRASGRVNRRVPRGGLGRIPGLGLQRSASAYVTDVDRESCAVCDDASGSQTRWARQSCHAQREGLACAPLFPLHEGQRGSQLSRRVCHRGARAADASASSQTTQTLPGYVCRIRTSCEPHVRFPRGARWGRVG